MTGAEAGSAGQSVTGLQSKSLGHSTLKEKLTSDSRGSKPWGGVASSGERTRLSR